ncbi:MAG: signal peptidase II [Candidatus Omnitrophica bacterium]|nr:signal peptidase II [Candidatus Omnitrophota bacterium]HOX54419.1 signal peptidase II [Candidatus Omnitrophota bacterium]
MLNIIVFILILIVDQVSKGIIFSNFYLGQSVPVIPNIFHLTLVYNTGIAFGLFKNQTLLFSAVSFFVIALIILSILDQRKRKDVSHLEIFALYLILSGAIGNLVDRFRLGFVVDFLDFRVWPVFNVADSAITIGVILILIRCIRSFYK